MICFRFTKFKVTKPKKTELCLLYLETRNFSSITRKKNLSSSKYKFVANCYNFFISCNLKLWRLVACKSENHLFCTLSCLSIFVVGLDLISNHVAFRFDHIFERDAKQEEVFENVARDVIDK